MAVEHCGLAVRTGKKSLTVLDGFRALFLYREKELDRVGWIQSPLSHQACWSTYRLPTSDFAGVELMFSFYWYLRLPLQIVDNVSKLRSEKIYKTLSSTATPHLHTVMRKIQCVEPLYSGINVLFVISLLLWNILRCLAFQNCLKLRIPSRRNNFLSRVWMVKC